MDKKVKKRLVNEFMDLVEKIIKLEEAWNVDEKDFPWALQQMQLNAMKDYEKCLQIRLSYAKVDWKQLVSAVRARMAID